MGCEGAQNQGGKIREMEGDAPEIKRGDAVPARGDLFRSRTGFFRCASIRMASPARGSYATPASATPAATTPDSMTIGPLARCLNKPTPRPH